MLRGGGILLGLAAILTLSLSTAAADKETTFDDAEFVKNAISGGMMEVELGKLGNSKALRPDVKLFAVKIESDHTILHKDLVKLAESMKIEAPKKMMAKHQEMVVFMTEYNGKNFDRDFMSHMIKGHEADIAEYKKASRDAKNAELKLFATRTLPALEEHLKLAKAIQEKVDK